jgi:hypothetical protein
LLSVDGTDCRIPERGPPWYSHKFKKSAVRYEVAVGIKSGDICWFSGPHMAGKMNDVEIFRKSLRTYLDPFERVEADDGYVHEAPAKVLCPKCVTCPQERKRMMAIARQRQETVNKRFKQWGILRQTYRHDLVDHRDVFGAIVVLTQLAIQNGEPLFPVEYND